VPNALALAAPALPLSCSPFTSLLFSRSAGYRHFAKLERAYLGNLAIWPWRNPNAAFIGQSGNHLAMWQTGYPTQT
jgi:hypothetical protein